MEPSAQGAPRGTVLVVDDDPDIRESLADVLELHGYAVLSASNGAEAVAVLEARRGEPCMVLLDLMMPVMSGHEFLRRVRTRPELGPPAVIVMTAGSDRPSGPPVLQVVPKPFELGDLLGVLETYCTPPAHAG